MQFLQNRPKTEDENAVDFINTWFEKHDIDRYKFMACIIAVMDQKTKKKNTIVLRGGSNAGKSLMVKLIMGDYPVARLGRQRDMDGFHWQPMLEKLACVFEELRIYSTTVDEFKQVLGGEVLDINVKNCAHQPLTRRPVIATSNHPIYANLGHVDAVAIQNRCYEFVVKDIVIGGPKLPFSLVRLTPEHFAHWFYLLDHEHIANYVHALELSDDAI
jgi:hypothetical protein